MTKKLIFVLTFLVSSQVIFGQFQDNFSDGDFAINPTWIGHDSIFTITSHKVLDTFLVVSAEATDLSKSSIASKDNIQ